MLVPPVRVRTSLKRILPDFVWNAMRAALLSERTAAIERVVHIVVRGGLLLSLKVALSSDYVIAYWWDPGRFGNFGDALNPLLIEALSGKKVVHCWKVFNLARKPVYYVIGSILRGVGNTAVVWGSGFIDSRDKLRRFPRKVTAVRGPLTRRKLLELGVDCPEVYGDPALLCPKFFRPSTAKRHSLGIVPHRADWRSPVLEKLRLLPDVSMIDVTCSVEEVIRGITECEFIASSSLHGLIVADAYGIPSVWVKISDKIGGDDFKFSDYFQSVGREDAPPAQITADTTLSDLLSARTEYRIKLDLGKLVEACPFTDGKQSADMARSNV